MKIDMSPEAVTNRMKALNQLWELAVALKSSVVSRDATTSRDTEKQRSKDES